MPLLMESAQREESKLIISLGILTKPWQLLLLMIAVVLLTGQAFAINRLAGIPYPLWNPKEDRHGKAFP